MSKPEICWCGYESHDIMNGAPVCAIHLAMFRVFPIDGHYKEAQGREHRRRFEQAIVEQVQARIRGD